MDAVPFPRPGELQRYGLLAGTPGRAVAEQLAQGADPGRRRAQVESGSGHPMRHARHAVGDRIRERAAGAEPEGKVRPSIADPEQDGGGQPVRLGEPVAVVVEEIRAVAAQEEQRHGMGQGGVVPLEQLAGRCVGESRQRDEGVVELPDPGLEPRVEAVHGRGKVSDQHLLGAAGMAGVPPLDQSLDGLPEEPGLGSVLQPDPIRPGVRGRWR